jgi:phosphatidylglycerophosphate synthase
MGYFNVKDKEYLISLMDIISLPIAKFIVDKTKITANQVTIFGFVAFVPCVLLALAQGEYLYNLVAIFFIACYAVLDYVDGKVARMRNMASKYGGWLDSSTDLIFLWLILCAVILGVVNKTGNDVYYILGIVMLFSKSREASMDCMFGYTFGFDNEKLYEFRNVDNLRAIDVYLLNVIAPLKTVYILLFTTRTSLLLFIVIDYLNIFIVLYTVTLSVRWLSLYFLYLAYLSDKEFDNLKIVSYLRSLKRSDGSDSNT